MGIFNRDEEIRKNPLHGVTFSIDPEAYDCTLGEDRVMFGDNYCFMNCGTTFNYQPVIVDGKEVAQLEEIQPYGIFEPMSVSYIVGLDENEVTRKLRKNPHFSMGPYENPQMRFATLQQLIDYLNIK